VVIKYFLLFVLLFGGFSYAGDAHLAKHSKAENIIASLAHDVKIESGKEAEVTVKLSGKNGAAILPEDLKIVHTQKIHALIIDPTLTDYNHKHPVATATPGEYKFSFTPKTSNNYRLWLEITPVNSPHEYIMVELKGVHPENNTIQKKEILDGVVIQKNNKYNFSLSFEEKPKAFKASMGNINVKYDNENFTKLQPVMGAFAHIAGFYADYKNIVHIHPMGDEPTSENQTGGPDLEFHIEPEQKGFLKLFAQVRINNEDFFVPFAVNVE